MGLSQEQCFVNYHRVLNRARWSPLAASDLLLRLVVTRFAPEGELVFGLDDTIERRRGEKIIAKGSPRPVSLRMPILSQPVGCGGSAVCCWPRCRGLVRCGVCLS